MNLLKVAAAVMMKVGMMMMIKMILHLKLLRMKKKTMKVNISINLIQLRKIRRNPCQGILRREDQVVLEKSRADKESLRMKIARRGCLEKIQT